MNGDTKLDQISVNGRLSAQGTLSTFCCGHTSRKLAVATAPPDTAVTEVKYLPGSHMRSLQSLLGERMASTSPGTDRHGQTQARGGLLNSYSHKPAQCTQGLYV